MQVESKSEASIQSLLGWPDVWALPQEVVSHLSEFEFRRWCDRLVDRLMRLKSVFVLEAYMVDEYVIQVKVWSENASYSTICEPWSTVTADEVSVNTFIERGITRNAMDVLLARSSRFSPSQLVRFILQNSISMPIIVSSNMSSLLRTTKGVHFFDHIVYKTYVPGSQRCQHENCSRTADAVLLKTNRKLFCNRHVPQDGQVMLYNPLLMSFAIDRRNIELAAIDLKDIFLYRTAGYRTYASFYNWVRFMHRPQPQLLQQTATSTDMFCETAANILKCFREHLAWGTVHMVGIDTRHSITCCLLKEFLNKYIL